MTTTPVVTTTLLLIRHAETDWNQSGRWQGHTDIPLNETGRRQAAALALRLAIRPFAAVYSSDLKRAAETATILAEPHGLGPTLFEDLRERSGGTLEGLTGAELIARDPELLNRIRQGYESPPGGESNADLKRRAVPALERIVASHRGESVAVVTHGGTLRVLIGHLLQMPPGRWPSLAVSGNTGLSEIHFEQDLPRLVLLNDTCHLDGLLGSLNPEAE